MRVSQIWRRVAASAKVVVFDEKKHFNDLARTRIMLSGDQPLDVQINVSTDVKFAPRTAKLLREHVSRIQTLNVRVPMDYTAVTLVSSIGEGIPAPLLERLDIHVEQDDDTDERYPEFTAFPNSFYPCPRLRHLTIPGSPLPVHTAPHFKSLTSLTIDATPFYYDMDLEGVLDILDSSTDLQHFAYLSTDIFNYFRITSPEISMPHLISANVSVPGCGLAIFCKLDAPRLTNVLFDGWRNESFAEEWVSTLTTPFSESLRLLSKRSPNLTHLELRSTQMYDPSDDYDWLMSHRAFPRLEVLRLYATDIADSNLQLSAHRMKSLKRLELIACMGISGDGILKFAKTRNQDFELLIDACPGVKPKDLTELIKWVKVL